MASMQQKLTNHLPGEMKVGGVQGCMHGSQRWQHWSKWLQSMGRAYSRCMWRFARRDGTTQQETNLDLKHKELVLQMISMI